ncbi:MAG: DUF373 family protein [Candidatus Aenigmarchaeota archaeon]|nr:DUF373 family protein [Candidatus Aenigmarchaeota archaeon]
MKKKLLILCVDRDDDVGRKTKYKGPIIGRDKNLKVATALALSDPEDSDANTMFYGVKLYDQLKKEKDVEVVTITGYKDVGIKSDEILGEQLEKVIKKTKRKDIVLVTDGAEDEKIIPIIQGKGNIVSTQRVVVKQSENLEGAYYMIHDFIEDPKMAKIFLGVPALALLLYALFGSTGWRIILGILGIYLIIKGFKLEEPINNLMMSIKTSLTSGKTSFFFYAVGSIVVLVGLKGGYDLIQMVAATDILEIIAAFLKGSIYIMFLASIIIILGRMISIQSKGKDIFRHITLMALSFSLSLVIYEASSLILMPEIGIYRLFVSIVFGFFIVLASVLIERNVK